MTNAILDDDVGGHSVCELRTDTTAGTGAYSTEVITDHLTMFSNEVPVRSLDAAADGNDKGRIAIIGMSMRGPSVACIEDFWALLADGRDGISRWNDPRPDLVPAEGILDEAEYFDNEFFGISATDAALTDPQHRVFMEAAWAALEDAGYDPRRYPGRIGLFGGVGMPYYWLGPISRALAKEKTASLAYRAELFNGAEFCTSRTAFKLGLRGPAITVNSACSTSLVAVHLARQALAARECDLALAGGASIASFSAEDRGYVPQDGGILSPRGFCRPFSADADGTVKASGVAIVVLKRLEAALRDRDCIRAVVLGSAVNNDGGRAVGFSAPSEEGQAEVLEAAYKSAGMDPASIAFVEAHGTGTTLGDATEVAALKRVFRTPVGPSA
jgi:acyl transferase domain-containing protein